MSDNNFNFGENWQSYLNKIDNRNISFASSNIEEVLGKEFVKNKSFIDIGCGSGIHSLSALLLGAKFVKSFDIDTKNIENTKNLIKNFWKDHNYEVEQGNILNQSGQDEKFDIIYSWGVLHHTGNLELAIKNSLKYCKNGSVIFLALYEKTYYCEIWKKIKKFYNSSNFYTKQMILYFYIFLKIIGLIAILRNPYKHIKNYHEVNENRGMFFLEDQIDWIGGYPYESITKYDLEKIIGNDFILKYYKKSKTGILRSLFGTGCSIYTFQKIKHNEE